MGFVHGPFRWFGGLTIQHDRPVGGRFERDFERGGEESGQGDGLQGVIDLGPHSAADVDSQLDSEGFRVLIGMFLMPLLDRSRQRIEQYGGSARIWSRSVVGKEECAPLGDLQSRPVVFQHVEGTGCAA